MEKSSKYKKGFVLGKFMPPHQGHQYLINSALKQVDELIILVCSIQSEPINGLLRYQWMKELYPQALVKHVTDEVPSYPHEHSNFWNIWTQLLKRETDPDTEVFFSSEDYGYEVAKRLNVNHVLIDKARQVVPISATAIRENPFAHWNFIPDIVKPYFIKKVVLTGPESTGKTTMAKLLADYYKTIWVEEFGREYFVSKNGRLTLVDFIEIAQGQIKLEDNALKKAEKIMFCDTDLIVTQAWSEIYFKECPPQVYELNMSRKYDLYLLMDIDIPWEDDGTREFPHLRQWHFNRIKEELDKKALPYEVISGTYEQRLQKSIHFIDNYFLR